MRAPLFVRLLAVVLAAVAAPAAGLAQTKPPDLAGMSIEELLNIEVTSASRKEQRASDVAAAVFVITHDDILRSGMTTIPDLLRLVPGVDVAQINSNNWAVSIRGFNGQRANKLLVLIDGRSVYNRVFSGVIWAAEDPMLDDVDRIEVIRGPGAAMWGANAVNGVINIVTKTAAETQGALVRADGGRAGEQGAVRYGGALGGGNYRLFAQWTRRDESLIAPDVRANDGSRGVTAGFRADRTASRDAFTAKGAFTVDQMRNLWPNLDPQTAAGQPVANQLTTGNRGHILGRWTHTRDSGASLQTQSFIEIADSQEPVASYRRHVFDVTSQYRTTLGARHDVVAGAGYRLSGEEITGRVGFSLTPADSDLWLLTAFVQDEIALFGHRLAISLGSQVQYDADSGAGVQPTARAMWKGLPRQRVWAAVSRAIRTPSLSDRGIRVDFPPVPTASGLPLIVTVLGNPAIATETIVDAEAGYRLELGTAASVDVTGFVGHYDHLQTQEGSAPIVEFIPTPQLHVTTQFGNLLEATTRGLEVSGRWSPVPTWRLDASYTAFHLTPQLAATSQDPAAAGADGSAPQTQWQLRSTWSPSARATLNVAVFHVGPLKSTQVAAYTRADITAEWRFTSRVSLMAIGQNLFDAAHAEFAGADTLVLATKVPRSAGLRLRWTFR